MTRALTRPTRLRPLTNDDILIGSGEAVAGARRSVRTGVSSASSSSPVERAGTRTGDDGFMRVVVLTGAGISAESGVATFRDAGGLWEGHSVEDVATPEGFEADAALVQHFYDARRRGLDSVMPNAAHRALADLEAALGDDLLVVTQNVDDLHERAGTHRLIHMHGELRRALCRACEARPDWLGDLVGEPPCPVCGERKLRPDVVWFGEMPYDTDVIERAVTACEVFVAIGTSGSVYPAAGYSALASAFGARTVELNLVASGAALPFDEVRTGRATEIVPTWVDEVVGRR